MHQANLTAYLKEVFPERSDLKTTHLEDITSGWETKIYAFDIEYTHSDKRFTEQMILRMYPGRNGPYNSGKEFGVLKYLSKVDYPVPQVHHIEPDGSRLGLPFIIMDRITGSPLYTQMQESPVSDSSLTLFCDLFVNLHHLDWKKLLKEPEITKLGAPSLNIATALKRREDSLISHERKDLEPILKWLDTRLTKIESIDSSIVHNDFHPWNIMIDLSGNPYVIDWTSIDVTDYRIDLAWTLLLAGTYRDRAFRDAILSKYEEISEKEADNIEFFEVFAILRRMFDISVSFSNSASELGMRDDAVEVMKDSLSHMKQVSALLYDYTGIIVPEFEKLLESIQDSS